MTNKTSPAILRLAGIGLLAACTSVAMAKPLPPARSTLADASGVIAHVVRKGDTAALIARRYGLSQAQWDKVAQLNGLTAGQLPATGGTLRIPLSALAHQPVNARLVATSGDVSINGKQVSAGHTVNENSKITTGTNSSAVVEMADGSRVKVLPQSVAEIVESRQYAAPEKTTGGRIMDWFAGTMRVTQGAIEAAINKVAPRAKPLQVQTPTSLIGVRGTEFRVGAADEITPYNRTEVVQGLVSNANTVQNVEIALKKGEGAVVKPQQRQLDAVPLLPPPAAPKGKVLVYPDMGWSMPMSPNAHAYRLMAAKDARFDNITYSVRSVSPQFSLSTLGAGTWHLRARAIDENGLEGMDSDTTVEIRRPEWNVLGIGMKRAGDQLAVYWSGVADSDMSALNGSSTVHVQLARSPDFKNPLASASASGPGQSGVMLPWQADGTYYLRLQAQHPELKNNEQHIYRFTLPFSHWTEVTQP